MSRSLDELLADVPFLEGLGDDRLALLAGCAGNVHFDAGAPIFREGEEADTFGAGEALGWSWLFPPYRWHFDARALSPVRATGFDGACLRTKCEADPALGYELMSRFAQLLIERLQWTRLRLLDVYGNGQR
jgi:CRP/FNR family transcriptional regulator, cyclic AMP receptor protein